MYDSGCVGIGSDPTGVGYHTCKGKSEIKMILT